MKKVWKYELNNSVNIPRGAIFLHIIPQFEKIQMWFLVDPEAELVEHNFKIFATGADIPEDILLRSSYLGTYETVIHAEIYHVFGRASI